MPDLIDLVRRRHGMARDKREENKLPILGDCSSSVSPGPAVFTPQSAKKRVCRVAFIKAKRFDSFVKPGLFGIQ
jgi:hypothetical protein